MTTDLPVQRKEAFQGGRGHILLRPLYTPEQRHGFCNLYAQVTLEPGCEIGYHKHVKEAESYYVVEGSGIYNDNGTERRITKGDITYTPDGCSHGLYNDGTANLVIIANIIPDQTA